MPDQLPDGLQDFVDGVVPICRNAACSAPSTAAARCANIWASLCRATRGIAPPFPNPPSPRRTACGVSLPSDVSPAHVPHPSHHAAPAARFRPVFARIADGAARREHERVLAHDAIGWLRDAGFGAFRVPREHGGIGATPEQLYELIIELAEADSNLPQALRAHFGFVERVLVEFSPEQRAPWLRRVADGAIYGIATTEAGEGALDQLQTRVFPENGAWLLSGEKFYSTGTLYVDCVAVTVQRDDTDPAQWRTLALVRTDAPGVMRIDD